MSLWKSCACLGFSNYEVSEDGRIRNVITFKEKALGYNQRGYLRVTFYPTHRGRHYFVHRLVALLWCPNPLLKTIVNHEDEDIYNNHRRNLRWVTPSENCLYSIEMKRKRFDELKLNTPF